MLTSSINNHRNFTITVVGAFKDELPSSTWILDDRYPRKLRKSSRSRRRIRANDGWRIIKGNWLSWAMCRQERVGLLHAELTLASRVQDEIVRDVTWRCGILITRSRCFAVYNCEDYPLERRESLERLEREGKEKPRKRSVISTGRSGPSKKKTESETKRISLIRRCTLVAANKSLIFLHPPRRYNENRSRII